MTILSLFWALVLGLICLYAHGWANDRCRFPRGWHGQWYQSGLGEVNIDDNSITRKGVCRDQHRDYYLFENTVEHCHQCLLIMRRHPNLLQYKESYCIGRNSLSSICAQIRVEAVLYTLVREPSLPVACPFQDAYHFTYNNNSGGFCRSPISYVHQCAGPAKFNFQFKQCQYSAYTYERDLSFECLATWKAGSDHFIYGGFTGEGITTADEMYRCVMYQILGTVVYLSVSADATCRGLRSPRDGPLVIEFTKDMYDWPESKCHYPPWVAGTVWRDLSGRHSYIPDPLASMLTVEYKRNANSTGHVTMSYHCMDVHKSNETSSGSFIALAYVLDHCEHHYRCIKIVRRQPQVLEIHTGDFVDKDEDHCTEHHFVSAGRHLLVPRDLDTVDCPLQGRYQAPPDGASCQSELHSGCRGPEQLQLTSSCHSYPVANMECLKWWVTGDTTHVIARQRNTGIANCFGIRTRHNRLEFSIDNDCNYGVSEVIHHKKKYKFDAHSFGCQMEYPTPAVGDVRGVDVAEGDPGGGYTHLEPKTESRVVQEPDDELHEKDYQTSGSTTCRINLNLSLLCCVVVCQLLMWFVSDFSEVRR